jgi:methionyl-tRNA synthetase
MSRILVGVAWPYANGPFHIGHLAGAYLPADIFARFQRLRGNEVLMVSGSDMHGTPVLFTAEKEGVSPAEIAERYHRVNSDAFRRLGLTYDLFTSTHTSTHERVVQDIFLTLLRRELLDRRTEANAYCSTHRRFLPDRYVVGTCPYCGFDSARGDECDHCGRILEPAQLGTPRCALDGTPAEFRPTEHFYLRLDKLQPAVEKFLADKSYWRANVLEVTRHFLTEGLKPRPITRDLEWGVPIPLDGYATKRIYVWFEAVIGYLSASQEWAEQIGAPERWKEYWAGDAVVRAYYFVGKDNIFFHTLLWPAILTGYGSYALPYDVPANEWMQIEGRKISKSRSSDASVFVPWLLDHYAPDVIRFYAAALAPQNHDTEFDWDEFHRLADEVLANQFGNLVQRVLVFARDHFGGRTPPAPSGDGTGMGEPTRGRLAAAHDAIARDFEAVRLKEALERALTEVRESNRWFQDARPWQASDADRARIVREALWRLKAIAIWLHPILPFSTDATWRMLGLTGSIDAARWDDALLPPPPGRDLGVIQPLFPKRDEGHPVRPTGASPASAGVEGGSFVPLAIRAGQIIEADPHPQADRLYRLVVDLGESKPRTVVAGIRPFYRPEELVGRRIALLANLEPRTIRRITSQGMILAVDDGEHVTLLSPPADVAIGTFVAGADETAPTIPSAAFESNPLVVGKVLGPEGDGQSQVQIGDRTVTVEGGWPAGAPVVVQLGSTDARTGRVIHFAPNRLLSPESGLAPGTRVR